MGVRRPAVMVFLVMAMFIVAGPQAPAGAGAGIPVAGHLLAHGAGPLKLPGQPAGCDVVETPLAAPCAPRQGEAWVTQVGWRAWRELALKTPLVLSPGGTVAAVATSVGCTIGCPWPASNGYTALLDALTGDVLWEHRTIGYWDRVTALAFTPDDQGLFAAGYASIGAPGLDRAQGAFDTGIDDLDILVLAFDVQSGAVRWSAKYDAGYNEDDRAHDVKVSPDGKRVFVTGRSWGLDHHYNYTTIAFDAATGARLWEACYDGPGEGTVSSYDDPTGLVVSGDGATVVVTGYSAISPADDRDVVTVAYEAADGAPRWVTREDGPGDAYPIDLALDSSGRHVYVVTTSQIDGRDGMTTLAYRVSDGRLAWRADHRPAGESAAAIVFDVVADPRGELVFITGTNGTLGAPGNQPFVNGLDFYTVAYDAAGGGERWARTWKGYDGLQDAAGMVATSPDGARVYVAGPIAVVPEQRMDIALVQYSRDGQELDTAYHAQAIPEAMAVGWGGRGAGSVLLSHYAGDRLEVMAYDG